ncbi:MAG: outer membrane protein OmpA-like peptidoglycan-associated protein [Bacteroidia bacterium]|jgi:outer membrane protein OmpA-like peptidoglycan-associated protein
MEVATIIGQTNSVRDAPEVTVGANEIGQDGNYETPLYQLQTETVNYARQIWHASATFGFKFRLTSRIGLNLSYTAKFANTDYLDDVSKPEFQDFSNSFREYANNPADFSGERGNSSKNDIYTFTSIGLHYSFGRKKQAFKTPEIYTFSPDETSTKTSGKATVSNQKKQKVEEKAGGGTTNLGINLNKPNGEKTTKLRFDLADNSEFELLKEGQTLSDNLGEYIYTNQTDYVFFDSTGNIAGANRKGKSTKLQIVTADDKDADSVKNLIDSWVEKERKQKTTKLNIVTNQPLPDSILKRVEANELAKNDKSELVSTDAKTPFSTTDSVTLVNKLVVAERDTIIKIQPKMNAETVSFSVVPVAVDSTLESGEIDSELVEEETDTKPIEAKDEILFVSNFPTTPTDSVATDNLIINSDSVFYVNHNSKIEKNLAVLQAQMELMILIQKKNESVKKELAGINQKLDNMNGGMADSENAQLRNELAEMRSRLSQLESNKTTVVAVDNSKSNSALEELALYKNTTLFFPINVSNLSGSDKMQLQKLANYLKRTNYKVGIRGYTDKLGNALYNKQLAMKRVEATKIFLVNSGIAESRITIDQATPDLTVGGNSSYGRRVELEIGDVK